MAKCEVTVSDKCEAPAAYRSGTSGVYTVTGENAQYVCWRCGSKVCGECSRKVLPARPRKDNRKHRMCLNCIEDDNKQ